MANLKIQLIVDGDTEYFCLPAILKKLNSNIACMRPFNMRGKGYGVNKGDIVKNELVKAVEIVTARNPDLILIVADKEIRPYCPGEYASCINDELANLLRQRNDKRFLDQLPRISIVVVDHMYENWLIADPDGISEWKHFKAKANPKSKVGATADSKDAINIINSCMKNRFYDKKAHPGELTKYVDFTKKEVQKRSKSLVKFLKETQCL